MTDPADIQRQLGDVCRIGTVASVDLAAATCAVTIGDILAHDLPWLAPRAGATRIWLPPSVGEQVLVLAPEGDTEAGIVVAGLFCDAHPAPSADDVLFVQLRDGAVLGYDSAAHHFHVDLPVGATAEIRATGGIKLVGPVVIEGGLKVSEDVEAGPVSLRQHRHGQVAAGSAMSGKPA